jgi:hypothetical protein
MNITAAALPNMRYCGSLVAIKYRVATQSLMLATVSSRPDRLPRSVQEGQQGCVQIGRVAASRTLRQRNTKKGYWAILQPYATGYLHAPWLRYHVLQSP